MSAGPARRALRPYLGLWLGPIPEAMTVRWRHLRLRSADDTARHPAGPADQERLRPLPNPRSGAPRRVLGTRRRHSCSASRTELLLAAVRTESARVLQTIASAPVLSGRPLYWLIMSELSLSCQSFNTGIRRNQRFRISDTAAPQQRPPPNRGPAAHDPARYPARPSPAAPAGAGQGAG